MRLASKELPSNADATTQRASKADAICPGIGVVFRKRLAPPSPSRAP